MPRPKGSAKIPGSGRKKGTPNKATVSLKEAFREHGPQLIAALLALTNSADERVRIAALRECLDRAFGRPRQVIEQDPEQPLEVRVKLIQQQG